MENSGILLKGATGKITSREGGFLNFRRSLMTAGLPLMKTVLTPLAKSILIPLGLAAAVSVTYAAIPKKIYGWGTTALIISNDEMKYIMKIVKLFEESGLLIKAIGEKLKNEAKEQKGRFLPVLLRTLAASTLGNALRGQGKMSMWACKGVVRAGQNF